MVQSPLGIEDLIGILGLAGVIPATTPPCEKKEGKIVEPKMCQCFSAATAMKYGPQNTYTATGINSNTFVAHFLKHCGMKCDFPSGSIGSGILTRPREDLFRITPKEFERLLKEGRGHLPGGWRSH
ncbi:MAG: hypothetical protein ACI97A_003251 [Planctomycetota bacterium]|jgi:hypothetical protein